MQTKRNLARRATTAIGGAFAAALILAACGGSNDTPDGAVENFLDNGIEDFANAFADADFDKAVEVSEDYFCAEDVQSIQEAADEYGSLTDEEREQIGDLTDGEEIIPEDWSYEIGETTEDGDTATVEVEMTEGDNTNTESIDLVKEDDEWRICGFM